MEKIAILTLFYNNYNYGGVLQALALQKVLEQKGFVCDVINYDRFTLAKGYSVSNKSDSNKKSSIIIRVIKRITGKIKKFIFLNLIKSKLNEKKLVYKKFQDKYIRNTELVYNSENINGLNDLYDIFVSGSDQVWSPISSREDFFLAFVSSPKRKIAYAASIGADNISDDYKRYLSDRLANYDYASVRESSAKTLLFDNHKNCDLETVLDPTLLYDCDWSIYMNKPHGINISTDYVLMYFLGESDELWNKAYKAAKQTKKQIINIAYNKLSFCKRDFFCRESVWNIGPGEFLWLIKHAEIILTDSFHGTVFSVIFHKQFWVFQRKTENLNGSMNGRLKELIVKLNLSSAHFFSGGDLEEIEEDWAAIEQRLSDERFTSNKFLQMALFNNISN